MEGILDSSGDMSSCFLLIVFLCWKVSISVWKTIILGPDSWSYHTGGLSYFLLPSLILRRVL